MVWMHAQRHVAKPGVFLTDPKILVRTFERHGRQQNLRTPHITGSLKNYIEVRLVVLLPPVDPMESISSVRDSDLTNANFNQDTSRSWEVRLHLQIASFCYHHWLMLKFPYYPSVKIEYGRCYDVT